MGRGGKVPDTKNAPMGTHFSCSRIKHVRGWEVVAGGETQNEHECSFWGVVVAAAGRGWGWKVVESSQNPEMSICARFGDGSGGGSGQRVGNPKNEQSCSLSGLARWWWQQ